VFDALLQSPVPVSATLEAGNTNFVVVGGDGTANLEIRIFVPAASGGVFCPV
jgi:hypothetical protein